MTTDATLLIAGEPTLDDDRVGETVSGLRQILNQGRAILAITHDIGVATGIGGRSLILTRYGVIAARNSSSSGRPHGQGKNSAPNSTPA